MLIRNRLFKRIIAMILVFAMLLSYAPDKVFARDGGDGDPEPSSGQFSCDGFRFIYNEVNSWNNYSNAEVTIYNDSENDKSLWNMTLTYDGVIENIWNADIVECKTNDDGSYSYIIAPKTYNNTIVSGNCVSFGFIAYGIEKSPDMPMFMGFYNDQLSENEAGSDQNENPEIINGREYPIKEEWKALEYTLFSDAEKQSFNVNSMAVEGSVHTNGNFIFEGNSLNIAGTLESAAGITLKTADMPESQSIAAANDQAGKLLMPDITERIHEIIKKDDDRQDESCFEVYSNYTSFGSDHISLDKNIYVEDGLSLKGTTFDTSGIIMAKKDVEFNINDMNQAAEDVIFFASEEGNITINGTNINLKAVLYAPNGNVTINCNELHLTGRIIAKNIMISGTLIDIKSDSHDLDMLDDIGVFYHESLFSFSTKEEFENKISLGDYETEAEFDKVVVTDSNIYTENDPETESIKAGLVLEKKNDENGESYSDEGSWTAFCDSKQDDAVWSYFDLDALYPNDSRIELYGYASNDPNDLKNEIALDDYKKITYDEAVSFDGVSGIKGRYLSVKIIIKASSDNRSPFISKLLIAANTKKSAVDKQKEYVEKRVEGKDSLETNENAEYKYRVVTTRENNEKVIWQLDDEIKEGSGNDGSISSFSFDKGGNYVIKAYYKNEEAEYATILVTVNSKELVTEQDTEPNTEANTEANTELNTEPDTEPVTEPVTEPNTEPVTEPITESNTEPATEAATDPITEPVVDETTGEFFKTFDTKTDFSTSNTAIEPVFNNITFIDNNIYEKYGAEKGEGLALARDNSKKNVDIKKEYKFANINVEENFSGEYEDNGTFNGKLSVNIESQNAVFDEIQIYNGHAYAVSSNKCLWKEAKKICECMGGHLAVVNSQLENDYIRNLINDKTDSNYTAIGYTDEGYEGRWRWLDGSKTDYHNWHGGEPNNGHGTGRCQEWAFMYSDGTWDDGYETSNAYFVCEWDEIKNKAIYDLNTVALRFIIPSDIEFDKPEGTVNNYTINDLKDGTKEVIALINIDDHGNYCLPLSFSQNNTRVKEIIKDLSIYYCYEGLKSGKLYDIKLSEEQYVTEGEWDIIYDSGIEGAEWSYFDMKAYFHNDGEIYVYAYASDDYDDATVSKLNFNMSLISDEDSYLNGIWLNGRYIHLKIVSKCTEESITPFVDSITIGANTDKRHDSYETKIISKEVNAKKTIYIGEEAEYHADIVYTYPDNIDYSWGCDGDEYIGDEYYYYKYLNCFYLCRFGSSGSHKINLYLKNQKHEILDSINFDVNVADAKDFIDPNELISSHIDYHYFKAFIDKSYYFEGENINISTDLTDDEIVNIYYDKELLEIQPVKGEIVIENVQYGQHTIKIESKTIYGNRFSRVFTVDVRKEEDKVISFDKRIYYIGDPVKIGISKDYRLQSIYVDNDYDSDNKIEEDGSVILNDLGVGVHKLKVWYTDTNMHNIDLFVYINDFNTNGTMDMTAPVINITSPKDGDVLNGSINIYGTIKDETELDSYFLGYRKKGESEFKKFAEGYRNLDHKYIGKLDISYFKNGSYEIKISATDKANNKAYKIISFEIDNDTTNVDSYFEYEMHCEINSIYKDNSNKLDIGGIVSCDGYLSKYRLYYQKEGDTKATEIVTGYKENEDYQKDGKELGYIDLDDIKEGKYYIYLDVEDIYGNCVSTSANFIYSEDKYIEIHKEEKKVENFELRNNRIKENEEVKASDTDASGTVASDTDASKETEKSSISIDDLKKGFKLSLSYLRAAVGQDVRVYVIPGKGMKSESLKIYKGDELLTEKDGKIHFTSEEAGKVTIKAVYCLDEKNQLEGRDKIEISADCIFFDDTDIVAPTGEFIAPDFDEVITKPVKVYGSVHDEKRLDFWRLEYKLLPDGDYKTISTGNENIEKGELGEIDPTLLVNGEYELRLWIQDMGGNYITVKEKFHVEGNLKIGNFHIGFTDMVVDMAGTKVNVNRIYDSRCPSNGKLGYGWNSSVCDNIKLFKNYRLDEGYYSYNAGITKTALGVSNMLEGLQNAGYASRYIKEDKNHDIYIRYGDGSCDRFKLIINECNRIGSGSTYYYYECITDQNVKLEILNQKNSVIKDAYSNDGLSFYYGQTPLSVKLIKEDIEYYINEDRGLYRIIDEKGNVIDVTSNGYISSDGNSILFTKDEQGRIIKITDPDGNEVHYSYDINGDLVSVTDIYGKETFYSYDNNHQLISIKDENGVEAARNEYDDKGRLVAVIDAEGNRIEYEHDLEANEEVVTDRNGNVTVYSYDDWGNVIKTVDALGNVTTSEYYPDHKLKKTVDALGYETLYTYDECGNLETKVNALGETLAINYLYGNICNIQVNYEDDLSFYYNNDKNLTDINYGKHNAKSFSYDKNGNTTGIYDNIGTVSTYKYDEDDNVIEKVDGEGHITRYNRDEDGRVTSITQYMTVDGIENAVEIFFTYDKKGNIIEAVDASGNKIHYFYDDKDRLISVTDSKDNVESYTYDKFGNKISTTYADGSSENYSYDPNGNLTKITNSTGVTLTMSYDKLNRMTSKELEGGGKTVYTYDAVGNVTSINYNGNVTKYCYDGLHRNTAIIDPYDNRTEFKYDKRSNIIEKTTKDGSVYKYEYDDNNNIISVTRPDGNYVKSNYDERNQLIETVDAKGNTTSYNYDNAGHLTSVEKDGSVAASYSYDSLGNVTKVTDAAGVTFTYDYDIMSRVIRKTNGCGKACTYSYDDQGNLISFTDYAGNETVNEYDSLGRLIKSTTGGEVTAYDYGTEGSDFGKLVRVSNKEGTIRYSYDKFGRVIKKTDVNNVELNYEYSLNGQLSKLSTPYGSTSYFYDKMDRIVRVVDHNGNVTLYSYDALGNRESLTYANGIKVKYKYDTNSLLSGIDIVDSKTNIIKSYIYKRDENGYPVSIEEKDAYGTVKIEYEYDSCNRLSYEKHDNGEGYISYQYSYDEAGNRTSVLTEKHGNISGLTDNPDSLKTGVTSYLYGENNLLLETEHNEEITHYSYDERGNLISIESPDGTESFEYNCYNELESVKDKSGKVTKYSYDAEGNRISKSCQNNVVKYVTSDFDGLSYVVLELSKDNNNGDNYSNKEHSYSNNGNDYSNNANNYSDNVNGYSNEKNSGNYDSYKDLKLNKYYTLATELIGFEADGKDYSYILNGHEDVTFVTDKAGKIVNEYSYDSYGNLLISREEVANSFRYNGQCYDTESGFYYLRARYMDPATGRFTQEDTYQGNLYDPATLHKYSYANDNPVVYCDPSGYSGEFISAIGAVSISVLISGTLCGGLSFVSALALGKKDLLKAFIEGFLIGAALTETGLFLEAIGFMSMLEYTAILSVVSFSIEAPQAIMSFAKGQISEGMVHTTYASLSAYGFYKSFGLLSNAETTISSGGKISEYANAVKDSGVLEGGSESVLPSDTKPDFIVTPEGTVMDTNKNYNLVGSGEQGDWFQIHNYGKPEDGFDFPHTHKPQLNTNGTHTSYKRVVSNTTAEDIDYADELLRLGKMIMRKKGRR